VNLYRITYKDNDNPVGQCIVEARAQRFAVAVVLEQAELEEVDRRILQVETPAGQIEPVEVTA